MTMRIWRAEHSIGVALVAAFTMMLALPAVRAQEVTAELVPVVEKPLSKSNVLPGELRAFQAVDIYARASGFVEKVGVDRASIVANGDVLATMSAPDLEARRGEAAARVPTAEAQLAEAEARLAAAQNTSDRLQEAAKTPGVVAANEVVLAAKAVDSARARVEAAKKMVESMRASVAAVEALEALLVVKAPFDGVITERFAHPGMLAGPEGAGSKPLFRLEEVQRLRLVAAVPEAYIPSVRRGAKLSFSVAAFPGRNFTGTVARPAYRVDSETRTMPVELDVANASRVLSPGMYAEITWPIGSGEPSVFVPPSAVKSTTERTFVVRVRGGKAEWVNVRRGVMDGDLLQVFGNLTAGDQVLRRGSDEVRPGTAVRGR